MQTSINESADKEIQAQLLEEHNQPNDPDNEDNTDQLVDEEEELQELAVLEKQDRIRQQKKDLFERKRTNEWKEKINGNPSEFFYYLLESIKRNITEF